LPLALLLALAGWALSPFVFAPVPGGTLVALILLGGALVLGFLGALRATQYADMTAVFLVGATFFGVGIFLLPVGVEELYAFMGFGIFTVQVSRFRSMVRPYMRRANRADRDALRRLYVNFLRRVGFLIIIVVILSLILFAAATGTVFNLSSEFTAFLLGLGILLALLLMARLLS
jgi:hypothetical protein